MPDVSAEKKALFAIKTNHPTRKVIEKVLYNRDGSPVTRVDERDHDADFIDMKESYISAISWMKNAQLAICDADGKFYPVNDEKTLIEQFDLVIAGEAPTVPEDANFGIHKPDFYITDPITGGETEESDVLGKKLGDIQNDVQIYNGVVYGYLKKVTNYTGFNGEDATEQNGYYLVFYIKKADMEAEPIAQYTDIKFLVSGGSGNEVTPDEGMNIIFLGATEKEARGKKLAIKAHVTVDNEVFGTYEADILYVLENKLQYLDDEISDYAAHSQLWINNDKTPDIVAPMPVRPEPTVSDDISDNAFVGWYGDVNDEALVDASTTSDDTAEDEEDVDTGTGEEAQADTEEPTETVDKTEEETV